MKFLAWPETPFFLILPIVANCGGDQCGRCDKDAKSWGLLKISETFSWAAAAENVHRFLLANQTPISKDRT